MADEIDPADAELAALLTDWGLIAAQVRQFREDRGMSQRDLAARIGQESPQWLSQVERGERRPSLPQLERLAAALGLVVRIHLERERK